MTWQLKVRGFLFAFGVLGALSLAAGADFSWAFRWVDHLF